MPGILTYPAANGRAEGELGNPNSLWYLASSHPDRKTRIYPMRLIRPIAISSVSILALVLCACGGGSSSKSSITLYSGQHEQTTTLLVRAFEKQTGIEVKVRFADEATLGSQILQEGGASPADVFFTENTPVLELLREKGALAPVQPSTLSAVPSRYDSAEGEWVGVSARVSALVYNTTKLKASELPGSVLELAQPRWKGKVGFAPSETDFQPLITAIEKLDGRPAAESWLKGLQANGKVYPDNESVVSQVNNGESELGPINHYYWYRLHQELGSGGTHSALHYFTAGDAGDLVNVSGAAVLKSSSHQAAAQRFLAFLVSRLGQRTLADSDSFEYPLRPGVSPPPGLRPLSQVKRNSLTPAQLGDGSAPLAMEQRLGLL
jgi:iron(III) transport system substrate-binding protein